MYLPEELVEVGVLIGSLILSPKLSQEENKELFNN